MKAECPAKDVVGVVPTGLSSTCRWNFPALAHINTGMFSHRARALFLLTGFFALQASALWSTACDLPGHHSPGAMAVEQDGEADVVAAMNGMPMAAPADEANEMIAIETPAPGSPVTPDDEPCDHATAPQDCDAMPVCSTVFISSSVASHEVGALPARIAVTTVLAPPSLAIPPDLPPPRA